MYSCGGGGGSGQKSYRFVVLAGNQERELRRPHLTRALEGGKKMPTPPVFREERKKAARSAAHEWLLGPSQYKINTHSTTSGPISEDHTLCGIRLVSGFR